MNKIKKTINNKRLSLILTLGFVLLGLVLGLNGYTLAKYLMEDKSDKLYTAEDFYFTSDYLQPMQNNGEYILYTLQEGVDTIQLQLYNYDDDLRSSEVDIEYEIYVDGTKNTDGNLLVTDEDGKVAISLENLVVDPNTNEKVYTVIAKAVSPYTKTIGARFKIVGTTDSIEYSAYGTAESPMMQLTVKTNDYSGNVVLTWDKDHVYPDKTDSMLAQAAATSGTCSVLLSSNSEYTFRFFKSDMTKDYSNTLKAVASGN